MTTKKKKKKKIGYKGQVLMIAAIIAGVMFSSLSVIAAIGMVPTWVAWITDRTEGHLRAMTVGAMNFAGCVPFMMEIFLKGNSMDLAIKYILEPRTIVVIYFAAAMGYLIDWAMTGIIASFQVQRTKSRLKQIGEEQKELTERWGMEVTGVIPLDEFGFPKDMTPTTPAEA